MDMCPGCGRPVQSGVAPATFGERVAELVATVGSSWTFVGLMAAIMLVWATTNLTGLLSFDPFPFILMNLWISVVTTFQGPVIMMSQNRIAVQDRRRAEEDYQVNVRAEVALQALHAKVDALLQGPPPPPPG